MAHITEWWSTIYTDTLQAACMSNPVMQPDDWFEVQNGRPHGAGLEAALVCRFACAMVNNCPMLAHKDNVSLIAGGYWFDSKGLARGGPDGDTIDINVAATYIGIGVERLRNLIQRRGFERPVEGYHSEMMVADMIKLAERYSPPHGTVKRLRLHYIRGEELCVYCAATQTNIDAELLKGVRAHAGVH